MAEAAAAAYDKYNLEYPQPELESAHTKGRFNGKVAIVTGGYSGIGRATVERLSNDGATVAIFARNKERGEEFASHLRSLGKNIKFYEVDVSDYDRCVAATQQVADDNGGRIHFLVNSHGIGGKMTEHSPKIFAEVLSINVIGAANMIQACLPYMKDVPDSHNCAVVNVSSTFAHVAAPWLDYVPYSTSKGGLHILTKCMALDLSKHGIRVNSVSPGDVWTPMANEDYPLEHYNEVCQKLYMIRRITDAAGVASVIAFLCSQDAMYIDGADIPVDSGYTAMGPEGLGGV